MTSEVMSNVESSFCHRTKNLEKNPKTNGTTLATVDSESIKCNGSYINVMMNQRYTQKQHFCQAYLAIDLTVTQLLAYLSREL